MQNQRGFVRVLIIVIGLIAVGGGVYYAVHQQVSLETKTQVSINSQTTQNESTLVGTPTIKVVTWKSESPATITISYKNLPKEVKALAVCMENGACTEWVEPFNPLSPDGTYEMSVKKAFGADSRKGLATGRQKIVAIGSTFSNQLLESDVFVVDSASFVGVKENSSGKSEIDKFGIDLYKLKEGETTVERTVTTEAKIIYTRNGDRVSYTATTANGARDAQTKELSKVNSTEVDSYGTDLMFLRQGETSVEKTLITKLKFIYVKKGDQIERTVTEVGNQLVYLDLMGTPTIYLNAKERLLTTIEGLEKYMENSCKSSLTKECAGVKKSLDILKAKCDILVKNEEIGNCMLLAGLAGAVTSSE